MKARVIVPLHFTIHLYAYCFPQSDVGSTLRLVDAGESPYRSANAFEFARLIAQGGGWVHVAFFRASICNAEKCCLHVRFRVNESSRDGRVHVNPSA